MKQVQKIMAKSNEFMHIFFRTPKSMSNVMWKIHQPKSQKEHVYCKDGFKDDEP